MTVSAKSVYRPRMSAGQFIEARITPGVIASITAADELVLQEAQAIVPIRTGELQSSGKTLPVEQKGSTVVGGVAFTAGHAAYVEFGTGIRGAAGPGSGPYPYSSTWPGMSPRPYLRPALDTAREAIRALFRSQIALSLNK